MADELGGDMKTERRVFTVPDRRVMRPVIVHDGKTMRSLILQLTQTVKVESCEISFATPNNVTLFVSIADREGKAAKRIFNSLIAKALNDKRDELEIKGSNLKRLYNYLEHIQSSAIAIYTALESLANVAIPNDYKVEKRNQKGVTEVWDKFAIERWYKLSDKLSIVLPEIFKVAGPKGLPVWEKFKRLEDLRNNIIHQKTAPKSPNDVDGELLRKLMSPEIFETINAGFEVVTYFCAIDNAHSSFPLGFGDAVATPEEVEDFSKYVTVIKRRGSKKATA